MTPVSKPNSRPPNVAIQVILQVALCLVFFRTYIGG